MARVFVFSEYGPKTNPSIEEVSKKIPEGGRIIAYNISDEHQYYMVAFDTMDETYTKWCNNKDNDIPIYLKEEGLWILRS